MCEDNFAKEIAEKLMKSVNTFGTSGDEAMQEIIDCILSEHRTLQQAFFGSFVLKFIETVANKEDYCFDGRNEFMQTVCKKIALCMVENDFGIIGNDYSVKFLSMPCI